MTIEIDKKLAIQLFACAREGERSVDFALMGPGQWQLLHEYYRREKREMIGELLDRLKLMIPSNQPLVFRDQFLKGTLAWLLRRPFIRLTNRTKQKWRFSRHEIAFIHQSLDCLLGMFRLQPAPPALMLVNLRMDLFTCEHIIDTRLHGIPEIERALRIEHFCQSDYIEHVRIEDLLQDAKTRGATADVEAPNSGKGTPKKPTNRVA